MLRVLSYRLLNNYRIARNYCLRWSKDRMIAPAFTVYIRWLDLPTMSIAVFSRRLAAPEGAVPAWRRDAPRSNGKFQGTESYCLPHAARLLRINWLATLNKMLHLPRLNSVTAHTSASRRIQKVFAPTTR